jgi:hypothetical protein
MSTTPDLTRAEWIKSSYSGGNGGQCVEFSRTFAASGIIPVRDSKDPQGPALAFSEPAWTAFVESMKRGEQSTL